MYSVPDTNTHGVLFALVGSPIRNLVMRAQGHGRASRSLASDAAVVPKGQNRNEGLGPMDQVVRMRRCTGGGRLLPLVARIR